MALWIVHLRVFMISLLQITQPPDLLALEQHVGVKVNHLLEDSVTVIIPMGPGHEDDVVDLDEDIELVDVQTSKALAVTLELAVCNASGKRPIEVSYRSAETGYPIKLHILCRYDA